MLEWLINKDDCNHWFQTPQQVCGDVCASITTKINRDGEIGKDKLKTTEPNHSQINNHEGVTEKYAVREDINPRDRILLEHLRSNPSLIADNSSAISLTESKTIDQHSISSDTIPSSNDDNETVNVAGGKPYRFGRKYLLFAIILIALVAGSVAIVLSMTLLRESGDKNLSNPGYSESDEIVIDNDESASNENFKYDYTSNSDYLVGVYYYPWYGEDFHRGQEYLRENLIPPQQPALGEYNDSDPNVIGQHMKWFRQANIGLLVTSWWGPGRIEDNNTKDIIMEHEDVGNLKIALHYETTGRIKDSNDMSGPRDDLQYICKTYFDHPNYYKIDGRPVLFVYVTRVLHNNGVLEEALLTMRSEASKCGHNLYLVGDQVFQSAPDPNEEFLPFWYFDAVTNFDVYGSSGRPELYAGRDSVDQYYFNQKNWKAQAQKENCRYVPAVSPGYNDRSIRLDKDHPPLSRRLTNNAEEGSLFWYQLKQALQLVDRDVDNMIMVNSFNEWHEDTQIEPAVSISSSSLATNEPEIITGGIEYVGYGDLYLDILGAATSKNIGDNSLFDDLYGQGYSEVDLSN